MTEPTGRTRPDGRRQLLVYLKPEVIMALKMRAMATEKHAYELVEEALERFLREGK